MLDGVITKKMSDSTLLDVVEWSSTSSWKLFPGTIESTGRLSVDGDSDKNNKNR